MYDDVRALFYDDVLQSYREFHSALEDAPHGRSRVLRAAARAAASLFHFREHLPDGIKPEKRDVALACPDYLLTEDIVNVSKHGELTQGKPKLTRATDLTDFVYLITFEDEEGSYYHRVLEVRATLSSGDIVDVRFPLAHVLNYWGEFLVQNGVLASFDPHPEPQLVRDVVVAREKAMPLNMEGTEGVRWGGFSMAILMHDPCLGGDFSPSARAGILSANLNDSRTGEGQIISLAVTSEELVRARSLSNPQEERAFFEELMRTRIPIPSDGSDPRPKRLASLSGAVIIGGPDGLLP